MEILTGGLYFISDAFFQKVQDPYLKINYEDTKRPHYFAFNDNKNGLYWLVPCSSKIEKFEQLIRKKQEQHKLYCCRRDVIFLISAKSKNNINQQMPSKLLKSLMPKLYYYSRICFL